MGEKDKDPAHEPGNPDREAIVARRALLLAAALAGLGASEGCRCNPFVCLSPVPPPDAQGPVAPRQEPPADAAVETGAADEEAARRAAEEAERRAEEAARRAAEEQQELLRRDAAVAPRGCLSILPWDRRRPPDGSPGGSLLPGL